MSRKHVATCVGIHKGFSVFTHKKIERRLAEMAVKDADMTLT